MRTSFFTVAAIVMASAGAQVKFSATLPATAPTQSAQVPPAVRPNATGKSSIAWTGAVLSVDAGGDSLRNILRQVARATGMKVTGGVPEEQVFGSYGPGSVQQVLASLFNGLSVNMMLVNGSPTQPRELLLTARTGGPTPPSPTQPFAMTDDPADVNLAQPQPGRHSSPESFGGPALQNQPSSNSAGSAVPLNDGSSNSAPVSGTGSQQQSPNGVRTPEQIFEELRKRQRGNTAP